MQGQFIIGSYKSHGVPMTYNYFLSILNPEVLSALMALDWVDSEDCPVLNQVQGRLINKSESQFKNL
jgi:hypothetical protein